MASSTKVPCTTRPWKSSGNPPPPQSPVLEISLTGRKIELALHAVGAELKDVVRTRLLVTKLDKESLREIARAHRECILDKVGVAPVCTLIGVAGLAHPDILCEIETDAFVTFPPISPVTD
jgi:enamine deaminase RidA (YjgF/YER057c/UK114 family)